MRVLVLCALLSGCASPTIQDARWCGPGQSSCAPPPGPDAFLQSPAVSESPLADDYGRIEDLIAKCEDEGPHCSGRLP